MFREMSGRQWYKDIKLGTDVKDKYLTFYRP